MAVTTKNNLINYNDAKTLEMDIIKHNPPSRGTRVLANMIQRLKFFGVVPAGPTREFHHVYDTGKDEYQELQDSIRVFGQWLETSSETRDTAQDQKEAEEYYTRSTEKVLIDGKEINCFAPYNPQYSAIKTITPVQTAAIATLILVWAGALIMWGITTIIVSIGLLTAIYAGDALIHAFLATRMVGDTPETHIDDRVVEALTYSEWPAYTVLCPLYKETEVVPQFVQSMLAMDYPVDKLQILFLTEEDDAETRNALLAMKLPNHFHVITVPDGQPRTKPRACNYGLLQATGKFVVIYDAEDIPDPLQLKKAVLTFAKQGEDTACVQAKLNFYNPAQNLLTRWFAMEYSLWFDVLLPGLQWMRFALPLGGTSNHFRISHLRKVGAWDPYNVTEDCDLGLRLAGLQYRTAMLDSTTYEEANPNFKNWIRQRSRWIKGYMQTYLTHMRNPARYIRQNGLRGFLSLQFVIGAKSIMLLTNPLLWIMFLMYILFRTDVSSLYHVLYPAPTFYASVVSLVFGNFLFLYMALLGAAKRGTYWLVKWALLAPVYWAMMSIAATVAAWQLVTKPHYWEKTKHGLHLKKQQQHMQEQQLNLATETI